MQKSYHVYKYEIMHIKLQHKKKHLCQEVLSSPGRALSRTCNKYTLLMLQGGFLLQKINLF